MASIRGRLFFYDNLTLGHTIQNYINSATWRMDI